MKDLSAIKRAINSFGPFFEENLPHLGNSDPRTFRQHCQKKSAALVETLLTCLEEIEDPSEAMPTIATEFHKVIKQILGQLTAGISIAELSSFMAWYNESHPLRAVFEFQQSHLQSKSGLRLFAKRSTHLPLQRPQIEQQPLLWPADYQTFAEDSAFALIDKVLQQLLAYPQQFTTQKDFIRNLITHQLQNKNDCPQNYSYKLLEYIQSVMFNDIVIIKSIVNDVDPNAYHERDYPARLLSHFSEHPEFQNYHEIAALYQNVIVYDVPMTCSELIAAVNTPQAAAFVFNQLWNNRVFLQNNDKLKAFLASEKLMNLLIEQIRAAKGSTLFGTELINRVLSLADSMPAMLTAIFKTCRFEVGIFFLHNIEIHNHVEKNHQARMACIARDFIRHLSVTWLDLALYPLQTAEAAELLRVMSPHASSTPLLPMIIKHLKLGVATDLQANPPKLQILFDEMRQLLNQVPARLATMIVGATSELFISNEILTFAETSHPFAPVAEALLSDTVVRGYLVNEMVAKFVAKDQPYLISNEFKPWLMLSASSVTPLIDANEAIKRAVIARPDFACEVIAKTQDDGMAVNLITHSALTLSNLTSLFQQTTLSNKVIRALLEKAKELLPGRHSTQQIVHFLIALNVHGKEIQKDEQSIATKLKVEIHDLFANKDLQDTLWRRVFAEYYAHNPDEISPALNEEQLALILVVQLLEKPKKFNSRLLNAQIGLQMLKNPDLNDDQYQRVLQGLFSSEFFTPNYVCTLLSTACNSLARAQLICKVLPFSSVKIFDALTQFTESELGRKTVALRNLILGTALCDHSLTQLSSIKGIRGYLLQIHDSEISVSDQLQIVQNNEGTLTLTEIKFFLSYHLDLSVADFKLIHHHFESCDLLYLVATLPNLNTRLSTHLLERFCHNHAQLHAAEIYDLVSRTLASQFSRHVINLVLEKLFHTAYKGNEIRVITMSDYVAFSAYKQQFDSDKKIEGDNGCFATSKTNAIVSASWYDDAKLSALQATEKLKELRQNGFLRDHLLETDLVAIKAQADAPVPAI